MGSVDAGQRPVLDVYARLSRAVDGQTIEVEDQVELGVEKIEARGGVVGKIHRDPSKSAWNPDVVRPQWNALMRRLESGASDGVMVYDLTRFSRKVMEGERLLELAVRGVRVWSLAGEYDLTSADGRRHFREAMVAAAAESDKTSERVKQGKKRMARRGSRSGGMRGFGMPGWEPAPKGWERGDPRVMVSDEQIEAERKIVRECYERVFAGESASSIARDLNRRGVATGNGNRWNAAVLIKSLRRSALAGLRSHNGELVGEISWAEPVVSREEWERVCAVLSARKVGRPAGRQHWLSNLLVCGQCGRRMFGAARNTMRYPDGAPRREYRCQRRPDQEEACGRNRFDARIAEQALAVAVVTRLSDPRRNEQIAARLAAQNAQRVVLTMELSRLNDDADQLSTRVADWGMERVKLGMVPILRRVRALEAEIEALDEGADDGDGGIDIAAEWAQAEADNDMDTMRAFTRRAFPSLVTVQPRRWQNDHSTDRLDFDHR